MRKIKIYFSYDEEHKIEFIVDEDLPEVSTEIGYSFFVKNPEGLKSKKIIIHPASVRIIEIEEEA